MTSSAWVRVLFWFALCHPRLYSSPSLALAVLVEEERVQEFYKRGYTWPPKEFVPNTEGWSQLMTERFSQIAEISDLGERYEGYLQTVTPALVVQNFTEYGFGLARAPEKLTTTLRHAIREGLASGKTYRERKVEVMDGPRAVMVSRPDLTRRVMNEMHEFVEAWVGIELFANNAYGFRLYQNTSVLNMHVDRQQTHVISFILHIDSSDDAEPWPLFIEDLHGNTHEVVLTPGDVLFYESSKVFHGRPRQLNGSWYTSVFVHYYPKHGWKEVNHELEAHYAIPPVWLANTESKTHVPVKMVGTGISEPSCPDRWCRTQKSIKWSGPGEHGVWIAPDRTRHPLVTRHSEEQAEL